MHALTASVNRQYCVDKPKVLLTFGEARGCPTQVIIMCVPQIGQFFRVRPQNWQEWLFALAVGFGSIIVAILTKLLSK